MARMDEDLHPGVSGPEGPTDGQNGWGPTPRCKRTRRTHRQPEWREDPHLAAIGPEVPTDGQDGIGATARSNWTRKTYRRPGWRRTHTQEQVDPKDPQKTRMEENPHQGATGPEGPTGPMVKEACRLGWCSGLGGKDPVRMDTSIGKFFWDPLIYTKLI